MAKISGNLAALAVAAFCIVLLASYATGPAAEATSQQAGKTEETHPETCILAEAFVVEVRLSALYELGVNPLGQKPDSVSVDNLLHCLDVKNIAQVTTGVKVSLAPKQEGKTKITETTYVEKQTRVPVSRRTDEVAVSKSYQSYDTGYQFDASVLLGADGAIFVDFEFSQSTFRNAPSGDGAPPNSVNRQWSGTARLKDGEPAIAGAAQNEETAAFLVLCANVKNK